VNIRPFASHNHNYFLVTSYIKQQTGFEANSLALNVKIYFFEKKLFDLVLALLNGPTTREYNVWAYNPTTDYYGPVCDNNWALNSVIIFLPKKLRITNTFLLLHCTEIKYLNI
jgi:hypothetical protein